MMIEYGLQDELARWMSARLGGVRICKPHVIFGFFRETDGHLAGAVMFNMYTGHDIEITIASEPGMVFTRKCMQACGQYVFGQLGCRRATLRTRADNKRAKAAMSGLGAVYEGCQRQYFGDCDAWLYGILREDYPA